MMSIHGTRYYRDGASLKYNLSFAGCGFLGVYHFGVISCMRRFAPHLYVNKPISGASAGAIAAVVLICDVKIEDCLRYMTELVEKSRVYYLGAFDPRFKITEYLQEALERLLPTDAHKMCSGRLYISMTRFSSRENVVVNRFKDKDDLIRAIICSSFIPLFGGFIAPIFQGDYFVDGALSDNLPNLDKSTITVSPFCGDADICPRDDVWDTNEQATIAGHIFLSQTSIILNWMNAKRVLNIVKPMSAECLGDLARSGYDDTLRFLLTRGLIACAIHRMPRAFSGALRHCRSSQQLLQQRRNKKRRGQSPALTSDGSPPDEISSKPFFSISSSPTEGPNLPPLPKPLSLPENSPKTSLPFGKPPLPPSLQNEKSTFRSLLCEHNDPLQPLLYKTLFGSRSLAVPECLACRSTMLRSHISQLPENVYNIIVGKSRSDEDQEAYKSIETANSNMKREFDGNSVFAKLRGYIYRTLTPRSGREVLAQSLSLLMASTSLQVSAVQSVTSLCISLIQVLPISSAISLAPIVACLEQFANTLNSLLECGTERTAAFESLLRSNQSLCDTFINLSKLISDDLYSASSRLRHFSTSAVPGRCRDPNTQTPEASGSLTRHARSLSCFDRYFFPMSPVVAVPSEADELNCAL